MPNSADVAWIDVLPSMKNFLPLLRSGTRAAAGTAGAEAGAAFGAGMASGVEAAAAKVAAAQKRAADATGQLAVAEAKLNEVRAAGTASAARVAAAEEAVAKAQRNVELQTGNLTRAQAVQERTNLAAAESANVLAQRHGSLAAGMGAVTGKASLLSRAVGGVNKVYGLMFAAMTATIPLLPIAAAVRAAATFQQSLVRLVTTAGESQANLRLVGDGMLAMAVKVGIGANDLAKGMYVVESAGFHGADALKVLAASAQGARQEQADLGTVANAVSTILHDYHLPAAQAADVTSQLVQAVAHGKTTFDELTGSLHSITPLASALHVPLADIAGALAAMTASGETAQQSTENMRNALMALAQPSMQQRAELEQLGITVTQLSDDLSTKGLAGTMQMISVAILRNMGPSGKVLLDALNKSKVAAFDMRQMVATMPAPLAKLSQGLLDGSVTMSEYRKAVMATGGQASAMGFQFLTLFRQADGFNTILRGGRPVVQTYEQALQRAVGTTSGLSVALQLTGTNADRTNGIIKGVASAAAQADGSIQGWSEVQGNFNQKLAQAKAAAETMGIEFGRNLLPVLSTFLGWVANTAIPGITAFGHGIGDTVHAITDFVKANSLLVGTLGAFLGGIGAAILAFKTVGLTIMAVRNTILLFRTAWALLNLVWAASPIGLVVTLLAGLAAAMVYAYEHSKTFRDIVTAVWHAVSSIWLFEIGVLVSAWHGFMTGVEAVWNAVGRPTLNAVVTVAGAMWTALKAIWTAISVAWHALGVAIKAVWDNVLHPVWDVLVGVAKVMAIILGVLVFGPIAVAWNAMSKAIDAAYRNIILPVWHGMQITAKAVSDFLKLIWLGMSVAWKVTGDAFALVWNRYIKPMWDAFGAAVHLLWDKVLRPTWAVIAAAWDHFAGGLKKTHDTVLAPIWKAIGIALGIVRTAFDITVKGIGVAWNHLMDVVATPVNFVIEVVFNRGLFAAWNWIVDHLGLPKGWHSPHWNQLSRGQHFADGGQVPTYANGGEIPGPYMGPTADNVLAMVGNNPIRVNPREWIHPVSAVDYYGTDLMSQIQNRRISRQAIQMASAMATGGQIPAFSFGGSAVASVGGGGSSFTWQALDSIRARLFPGSVMTSGYRPGANDYHGLGEAIDIGVPGNLQSGLMPIAATLARLYPNSTELIHDPNASIKNGHVVDPSFWGPAVWAAHANHVHWAMTPAALMGAGSPGGAGSSGPSWFQSLWGDIKGAFSWFSNSIHSVGEMGSRFGNNGLVQILGAMPGKLMGGMWDLVKGQIGNMFNAQSNNPASTGGLQNQAYAMAQLMYNWNTPGDRAALDYIVSHESGWNPRAQNPVSSASGLFQLIDGTWMSYRPIEAAAWNHAANAPTGMQDKAGLRYIHDRYGSLPAAQAFWASHHWYDTGGLWPSGTLGINNSGADERVLAPKQDDYFRRFVDQTSSHSSSQGTPVWHFYLGDREITDLVDTRLEWRDNQMARGLRSAQ